VGGGSPLAQPRVLRRTKLLSACMPPRIIGSLARYFDTEFVALAGENGAGRVMLPSQRVVVASLSRVVGRGSGIVGRTGRCAAGLKARQDDHCRGRLQTPLASRLHGSLRTPPNEQ